MFMTFHNGFMSFCYISYIYIYIYIHIFVHVIMNRHGRHNIRIGMREGNAGRCSRHKVRIQLRRDTVISNSVFLERIHALIFIPRDRQPFSSGILHQRHITVPLTTFGRTSSTVPLFVLSALGTTPCSFGHVIAQCASQQRLGEDFVWPLWCSQTSLGWPTVDVSVCSPRTHHRSPRHVLSLCLPASGTRRFPSRPPSTHTVWEPTSSSCKLLAISKASITDIQFPCGGYSA